MIAEIENTISLTGPAVIGYAIGVMAKKTPRTHKVRPLAERFWEKVLKAEGDRCWLWQGSINKKTGYGDFNTGTNPPEGLNQIERAHRVSYWLTHGEIPDGKNILHKCHIRPCVRPDHLKPGTQVENMEDCLSAGRHSSQQPKKKVKEKDFREVLLDYQSQRTAELGAPFTQEMLAEELGVPVGTLYHWMQTPGSVGHRAPRGLSRELLLMKLAKDGETAKT